MPRLSADALKSRIAVLQKQLADAERDKAPAVRKVTTLMKKLGVSVADLAKAPAANTDKGSKRPGRPKNLADGIRKPVAKVPVKYRDKHANTWTGRGKTPKWIVEAEKDGKSREEFRVAD
jgi:DNA-binding protein H-NS